MAPPPKQEKKCFSKLETMRFDPRFPNANQTHACYKYYCDFHKCQRLLGKQCAKCCIFKKMYTTMCPIAWIEKYDDQRKRGCFPGKI